MMPTPLVCYLACLTSIAETCPSPKSEIPRCYGLFAAPPPANANVAFKIPKEMIAKSSDEFLESNKYSRMMPSQHHHHGRGRQWLLSFLAGLLVGTIVLLGMQQRNVLKSSRIALALDEAVPPLLSTMVSADKVPSDADGEEMAAPLAVRNGTGNATGLAASIDHWQNSGRNDMMLTDNGLPMLADNGLPYDMIYGAWPPGIQKTVCRTSYSTELSPFINDLFRNQSNSNNGIGNTNGNQWTVELHRLRSGLSRSDACADSAIRILRDEYSLQSSKFLKHIIYDNHQSGQQLTATIYNSYIDKGTMYNLIETNAAAATNTTASDDVSAAARVLKKSVPATVTFQDVAECHEFCNKETVNLHNWLWKPAKGGQGRGIVLIEDSLHCHATCDDTNIASQTSDFYNLQAQALTDAMLTADGRKFDVRVHMLVTNVDPLILFTGADMVRMCIEPLHKTDPAPHPDFANVTTTAFNPFQHICNVKNSLKHPIMKQNNTAVELATTLSRLLPDQNQVQRLNAKLDAVCLATADLLKGRWHGKIGHFHLFALDFLISENEQVHLLEINKQPAVAAFLWPTLFVDMFRLVWIVFKALRQGGAQDLQSTKAEIASFLNTTAFRLLKI